MLVKTGGEQEELGCFERDNDTEVFFSCQAIWQNELHVFGGNVKKRQISKLNGHRLERLGSLTFDHREGQCSVMNNQYIYLCFQLDNSVDWNRCRRSTGPLETFSEIELSNHNHAQGGISCTECKL